MLNVFLRVQNEKKNTSFSVEVQFFANSNNLLSRHKSSISCMLYIQLSVVSVDTIRKYQKVTGWLLFASGVFITSAITSVAFVITQG